MWMSRYKKVQAEMKDVKDKLLSLEVKFEQEREEYAFQLKRLHTLFLPMSECIPENDKIEVRIKIPERHEDYKYVSIKLDFIKKYKISETGIWAIVVEGNYEGKPWDQTLQTIKMYELRQPQPLEFEITVNSIFSPTKTTSFLEASGALRNELMKRTANFYNKQAQKQASMATPTPITENP